MKVYLASGFFTPETRAEVERKARILRMQGHEVYVPMEHQLPNAWDLPHERWAREVFKMDLKALDECDKVYYLDFGANGDCGAAWECGYAYAKGKPYVVESYAKDMSLMILGGSECYHYTGRRDIKFV